MYVVSDVCRLGFRIFRVSILVVVSFSMSPCTMLHGF